MINVATVRKEQVWPRKIQESLTAGRTVPEADRKRWLELLVQGAMSRPRYA